MTKMNPDIKARWVAALRSGEYKQARNALRTNNNSFCCLGVLCNLHAQSFPKSAAKEKDASSYLGCNDLPPDRVVRWAKLPDPYGGDVVIDGRRRALSEHNDDGRTFSEIADAIEGQL